MRKGSIKLVRVTTDGRQRIVRVLRPGDVVGLEALATGHYNSQRLHLKLMQKWQQALKHADDWLADLNFGTARQRVCNLILKMRSPDDTARVTLFGRDDMGAMLKLKLENVSREVSRLGC